MRFHIWTQFIHRDNTLGDMIRHIPTYLEKIYILDQLRCRLGDVAARLLISELVVICFVITRRRRGGYLQKNKQEWQQKDANLANNLELIWKGKKWK